MPQSELFPILRAARLVVLPSLWENLANTCLEAMQLSRPVVATRRCGFEEVIQDGESGFLVEPGDAADLSGTLLRVLGDPAMLDRVGAQGRSRVGDFAIDAMARRLADYYEQLLSRRGQRRSNVAVVSVSGDTDRVEVAR
jgi:starch synthase